MNHSTLKIQVNIHKCPVQGFFSRGFSVFRDSSIGIDFGSARGIEWYCMVFVSLTTLELSVWDCNYSLNLSYRCVLLQLLTLCSFFHVLTSFGSSYVVFSAACVFQASECVDQIATFIFVVGPKETMWFQFTFLLTKLWTFNTPQRIILILANWGLANFSSPC